MGFVDNVVDGIKLVRATASKIQNAELQGQIADLMLVTADLKLEMAELKAEAMKLREENTALKQKRNLRSKMEVKGRLCYLQEDVAGYNKGPFCPLCLETDGLLVNVFESQLGPYCPHCQRHPG